MKFTHLLLASAMMIVGAQSVLAADATTEASKVNNTYQADIIIDDGTWDPYPTPDYPENPGRSAVVCYARNGRGEVFEARGRQPQRVQERAMNQCYSYSRMCRPMGCEDSRW